MADHWCTHVDADLIVFVDSDVEFRRNGWLREIVDEVQRSGCAVLYSEWLPESRPCVDGRLARLAGRPAPWLLGVAPSKLPSVRASFQEVWTETDRVPEGLLIEDVGAAFHVEALRLGARAVMLPKRFLRLYHHYGGLSWLPPGGSRGSRGHKKARDERIVLRRLRLLRFVQESQAPARQMLALALLPHSVEAIRELVFRVSAKMCRIVGDAA